MSASGKRSCHWQLSSTPASQSSASAGQQSPCELCRGYHREMSTPQHWKNEQTRELVISLGVSEHGLVCRPCSKDAARVVGNASYIPRWEKRNKESRCCVVDCSERKFACTKVADTDSFISALENAKLHAV